MRYLDTGGRDPGHALGSWLNGNVLRDTSLVEIRWQTGFFAAESLGYFAPAMARLRPVDGVLRVLIGSNDGITRRADAEVLLRAAGPPRPNRRIGIVSFDSGYYHPKTVHVLRADGSAAAYVGSANLTGSGVASLHVEAGLVLDTREGDDPAVAAQIASAIDWWFTAPREGLTLVEQPADLDALVAAGTLDVPPSPPPRRPRGSGARGRARGARLKPLVAIPKLPPGTGGVATPPGGTAPAPPGGAPAGASTSERWTKRLTRSDAQRKPSGNQRGSITLVQAGHQIDAQTYFRYEFFGAADWKADHTRTGETRETADVAFEVNFLGQDLGVLEIPVTYASNREAAQKNYTSLLHLGALASHFARRDVTDKWLILERRADGSYALSVLDNLP